MASAPSRATTTSSPPSKQVAVAVRVTITSSSPGSTSAPIKFALCWDMPDIKFREGRNVWRRRYATFFDRPETLLEYGFANLSRWVSAIGAWHDPVLSDAELPDWFKSAIFNEMYFIADGGTQWLVYEKGEPDDPRNEIEQI
jgi:non-lysosomal glucosylceramidase